MTIAVTFRYNIIYAYYFPSHTHTHIFPLVLGYNNINIRWRIVQLQNSKYVVCSASITYIIHLYILRQGPPNTEEKHAFADGAVGFFFYSFVRKLLRRVIVTLCSATSRNVVRVQKGRTPPLAEQIVATRRTPRE